MFKDAQLLKIHKLTYLEKHCSSKAKKCTRFVSRRTYRLIKVVTDRVCERSDGIVKDQQVLVLVLAKGKHQCVQNEAQVGNQFCTCFLFQCRKCTVGKKTNDDFKNLIL